MSRKRAYNWIFGAGVHWNFSTGAPIQLATQAMEVFNQREGCDSVSDDETGALLFYTDGYYLFDNNHYALFSQIAGNDFSPQLSMQAVTIIRSPGSKTLYYLFFVDNWNTYAGSIRYRTYNTSTKQLTALQTLANAISTGVGYNENLTAALHSNNTDYWIITKLRGNNLIRAWKLTASGIDSNYVDSVTTHTPSGSNCYGQFKVSPDRRYAAFALGGSFNQGAFLYKFNPTTGQFTNELLLLNGADDPGMIGLDFSPDSRKLYISTYSSQRVYKFRIFSSSYVEKSFVTTSTSQTLALGAVQLGPDNRIYIARGEYGTSIFQIADPNNEAKITMSHLQAIPISTMGTTLPIRCKLGLPVAHQGVVATDINDYRVYGDGQWRSVCAGDDIRYYDQQTTSWKKLNPGDKFYGAGAWRQITCSLPILPEYDVYNIVSIGAPQNPSWPASTFTQISVSDNISALIGDGSWVWVKETLNYNGLKYVVAVEWTGFQTRVVIQGTFGQSESSGKLLIEQQ